MSPGKFRVLLLEDFHDAQRVEIVIERIAVLPHQPVEFRLTRVAARRMADVVNQRKRLHQVRIQAQRLRHRAADLRDFQGVGQSIAKVIGIAPGKNLGLVFQAAKGAGMDDAVAVALIIVSIGVRRLRDKRRPCESSALRAYGASVICSSLRRMN